MSNYAKPLYGFSSGEVSPDFYGRVDLSKYDFGLKRLENFFVDYRGGVRTRFGLEFMNFVHGVQPGQSYLVRYKAEPADFLLLVVQNFIYPIQNGDFIYSVSGPNVSAISGNVITIVGHSFVNGDVVYVSANGATNVRSFFAEVSSVTTDTFVVRSLNTENSSVLFSGTTYTGTPKVFRVTRISHNYGSTPGFRRLPQLRFTQYGSKLYITSPTHPPAYLQLSAGVWTLGTPEFGLTPDFPAGPTLTPSGAGSAGVAYCYTAVVDGEETAASFPTSTSMVDMTVTAGHVRVSWPNMTVAGKRVTTFNVYRTRVLPVGSDLSGGEQFGYIGRAFGNSFVDRNITPDFTKTPPGSRRLFNGGSFTEIIPSGGTGYVPFSPLTITDAGATSPARATLVTSSGVPQSIRLFDAGKGYTAPVIAATTGTGVSFTYTLRSVTGNYPTVFAVHQQRGIFAGSVNDPMTLWGSDVGNIERFSSSDLINDAMSFELSLDSPEVTPIQHLCSFPTGLLVFSEERITLLRAEEGRALTGSNAYAEVQAYRGATSTQPVVIDLDVVFVQKDSQSVSAITYSDSTSRMQSVDLSVLSNHLVAPPNTINRIEWLPEPYKLLWMLRSDGRLLSLTYDRTQEVFGWAVHKTDGRIMDICAVEEGGRMVLYALVRRSLQRQTLGTPCISLERMENAEEPLLENALQLDAATRLRKNLGDNSLGSSLNYTGFSGNFPLTSPQEANCNFADTAFRAGAVVGTRIYTDDNVFEVINIPSTGVYTLRALYPINSPFVFDGLINYDKATWYWVNPTNTVYLHPSFRGENVVVYADGQVYNLTVETSPAPGRVTLPVNATNVSVGFPFNSELETLPLSVEGAPIELNSKRIVNASMRVRRSTGLLVGKDFNSLRPVKELTSENTTAFQVPIISNYRVDSSVCVRQTSPMPAHILGMVLEFEAGK